MSVDPQAAVASELAGGLAQHDDTAAGIYGDPAGASVSAPPQSDAQVAAGLVAAGAQAASGDVSGLQAQIDALNARLAAADQAKADAAAAAEPKPPVLDEVIGALSGVAPAISHAFQVVAARIDALEGKSSS